MARESSITLEQVAVVANQILKSGGKVTSRAIRDVLGSGSQGTICKLMQQWQSSQARQSEAIDGTISPSVVIAISNEIAGKVSEAIADVTGRLADLQLDHNGLIAENEVQVLQIELQAEEITVLNGRFSLQSGRNQQLESELASLISKLDAERNEIKITLSALARAELKLEALPRIEAELIAVRADLFAEKILSGQYHESSAVLAAKYDSEANQRKVAEANASDVGKKLMDIHAELNKEKVLNQALRSQLDTASRDLALAGKNTEKYETEIRLANASIAKINKAASELEGQVKLQNITIAELKSQISIKNKQKE